MYEHRLERSGSSCSKQCPSDGADAWGKVRSRLPFVTLPDPGDLLILRHIALRGVLSVHTIINVKRIVLGLWNGHEDGPRESLRDGQGDPGEENRIATTGSDRREKQVGSIICEQQTMHVVVGPFVANSDVLLTYQAEEAVVTDNLLTASSTDVYGGLAKRERSVRML